MPTQPSTVIDTIAQLNTRVSALESTSIDDNQPVDMFRGFTESTIATDAFKVFTHGYKTCSTALLCSTTYIL